MLPERASAISLNYGYEDSGDTPLARISVLSIAVSGLEIFFMPEVYKVTPYSTEIPESLR